MRQITFTDFKKVTREEIEKLIPFEVIFNGDPRFRVVPKTWRDPRVLVAMGEEIGRNAQK